MKGRAASVMRDLLIGIKAEDLHRSGRIKWSLHGPLVLPAWVAEMDFPIAPQIAETINSHLRTQDFGYPALPHPKSLIDAFVERQERRFGWSVDPSDVWSVVNVVQALDAAVIALTEPGGSVALPTPIYPPFFSAVSNHGRRILELPLHANDRRYEIDFDAWRAALAEHRPRLLLFCNPHNPTGRVFDRQEIEHLAALAEEFDLVILSDEIWSEVVYEPHYHLALAAFGKNLAERTITVTSATKAFNLAGLPWALAVCPPNLRGVFRRQGQLLGHGGVLGAAAATTAWTSAQPWLASVLELLSENRSVLERRVREDLPGVGFLPPQGTYLAWLDCRALAQRLPQSTTGESPTVRDFFFEQARVALSPGEDFGAAGKGFVRLNFATSPVILSAIVDRLAAAAGTLAA